MLELRGRAAGPARVRGMKAEDRAVLVRVQRL